MARTPHSSRPSGENGRALRTLALIAVVIGLVALTTAACLLSYSSVHDFALRAGITPSLARIYPDIGDAMLVMAGCSVLALRGAGVPSKMYGWLCFILLLGALAGSSVVHEAGLSIPLRPAEITAAVFPWALVLIAFGLLLALLRHARRRRQSQRASAAADVAASPRAGLEPPALETAAYEQSVIAPSVIEPSVIEPSVIEPEALEAGAYLSADGGEPYYYGKLEPDVAPEDPGGYDVAAPDEPASESPVPSEPAEVPEAAEELGASEAPEAPAAAGTPGTAGTQAARAVVRPTEMQLRARTPRQRESADPTPGPSATQPTPPPAASVTEPPTTGFTGDTIPRGELNPAPTPDQASGPPPELDRPHSSPTPPS